MKRILLVSACAITLAALAPVAVAQQRVDLRVDLSTQPVYGGYQPSTSYFGLANLYTTGNVRYGRAFMGRRNFLEDRYFGGSLTRFYRDTVGVSDVMGGASSRYGLAQPFYAPGSLVVSGRSVSPFRSGTPYGLSFNPRTMLPSPFENVVYVRTVPTEPTTGQYPTLPAMRTLLERATAPQATEEPTRPTLPPWAAMAPLPQLPEEAERMQLPEASRLDLRLFPQEPEAGIEAAEGEQPPTKGIRPLDYLLQQQAAEQARQEAEAARSTVSTVRPFRFEEEPEPGAEGENVPEVTLPEVRSGVAGRPQNLDEQYMALAELEMAAGAYGPAADAYEKVAAFNPLRRWESSRGEAFARLLTREYHLAAYLLKYTIVTKPGELRKDFRLTDVVKRPEDWQAVEKNLTAQLERTPGTPDYRFAMACLKLFSGKPAEAQPYLKSLENDEEYGEAVELLRDRLLP